MCLCECVCDYRETTDQGEVTETDTCFFCCRVMWWCWDEGHRTIVFSTSPSFSIFATHAPPCTWLLPLSHSRFLSVSFTPSQRDGETGMWGERFSKRRGGETSHKNTFTGELACCYTAGHHSHRRGEWLWLLTLCAAVLLCGSSRSPVLYLCAVKPHS